MGRRGAVGSSSETLIAQGELQPILGCFQPRILQRTFETGRVAPQLIERFRSVDDEARRDLTTAVDIEPHIDAAKLGWIEPDLEAVLSRLGAGCDLDRQPRDR